jgi:hypothetical protein
MLRKRKTTAQAGVEHVETAICIAAFRPAAISRMIEVGDSVRLDDEIVSRNPTHFAVRLDELLEEAAK